jgi:DNA repair exonuclease SbcCD ATPase subunit
LRSFGVEQTASFEHSTALVWGGNSQGKTSFVEAIEFLLTGTIVRRQMLGGAKSEYDRSLRNAYQPANAPAFVRAIIEGANHHEHQVERQLLRDFERTQECESRLLLDGTEVSDLESIGIRLAEPPLRAPVLFQHSLRYALTATPSERLTYFKAVLEISDLDLVTDSLKNVIDAVQLPPVRLEQDLASCLTHADLGPALAVFAQPRTLTEAIARDCLNQAAKTGIERLSGCAVLTNLTMGDTIAQLRQEIQRHEQAQFDFASWRPGNAPSWSDVALERCEAYSNVASQVDAETDRLHRLYEAVLQVPELATLQEQVSCPVCATGMLTPDRVAVLRAKVADSSGLRNSQSEAQRELSAIRVSVTGLERCADGLAPHARTLSDPQLEAVDAAARTIQPEHEGLRAVREASRQLGVRADELAERAREALAYVEATIDAVDHARTIDAADLRRAIQRTADAVQNALAARVSYLESATKALEPLSDAVARASGTSEWLCLLRLAETSDRLVAELRNRDSVSRARSEFLGAREDIQHAKLKVLRDKFSTMSDEIQRWWNLLRPDEPVSFKRAAPRAEGRRYVDMKATLNADGRDEERDALGIFSDSQLNALGLAAFLARATLQEAPFVVLDDPVQSGDDEHRDTFIDLVIPELTSAGIQVIVTSYDSQLRTLMTNAYGLDGFTVTLDEPQAGTKLIKGADTAYALLREAKAFIKDTPSIRATGAQKLRVAAERLAKEILVEHRHASGERSSLSDCRHQTLEKLVPKLCEVLTDEKERGWWRNVSTRLSPGVHDDSPPAKGTLRSVRDQLFESYKRHIAALLANVAA